MSGAAKARLVVLASGKGSNLQAVLDACGSGRLPARVLALFSDRSSASALDRARQAGVGAFVLKPEKGAERRAYDAMLAERVAGFEPDWVLLLGWMRLLSSGFLDHFPGRVINLHPALPGAYPGTDAIGRAFRDARAGGSSTSGLMCHLVPDEGVDSGPVLSSVTIPILPGDDLEAFEMRMHQAEHALIVSTLAELLEPLSPQPVSNSIPSGAAARTHGKE